jgi:hypothetical protein
MNKIKSVDVTNDLVEVTYLVNEKEEVARRHVDNYETMNKSEKRNVWSTLAGNTLNSFNEFTAKKPFIERIKSLFIKK